MVTPDLKQTIQRTVICLVGILSVAANASGATTENPLPKTGSARHRISGIEMVARLSKQPLHLVKANDGRMICTLFDSMTGRTELVEVLPDASTRPFPNQDWAKPRDQTGIGFSEIIGLCAGSNNLVGILDRGTPKYAPRVIVWDIKNNKAVGAREFQPVATGLPDGRFFQDLAIDEKHKCIYLAATSKDLWSGSIMAADFATGTIRVYSFSSQVIPEDGSTTISLEADPLAQETIWNRLNVPITIDPANQWVYFGSFKGEKIFRIAADKLSSPNLTQAEFAAAIETYGKKELSTHIVADDYGNVYCAEADDIKIGVYSPDGKYRSFAQDAVLDRPYGLALSRDGYLYITVNQLGRIEDRRNNAPVNAERPYLIVRVKAL